ncbi:MAG TPA: TetR family transcriptional regulator, partial [Arthrobacter sp.]|nr:TetR family transcriptional regulator [Arthrobacter sp.]
MSLDSPRLPYGDGRDALLAAVVDVVAEKGLRGVTYRSVAGRAGVNHTLITHHFGSIEGLLAATLEWAVQRSIDETGLARVADFDEQFADALLESVSSEPELQLFQFEMLLEARRKPELRALLDRLYDNYISTVEAALRARSLDTDEELSRAVFAALDGL